MTTIDKPFESKTTTQNIDTIFKRCQPGDNCIKLDPPYQRNVVWDEKKQSLFINSIHHRIIPNNLIFNVDAKGDYECIDGKQRITSIVKFKQNKLWFQKNEDGFKYYYSKIPANEEDAVNCRILEIPDRKEFDNIDLPIVTYKELSYDYQLEVFNRIQNGIALTTGELIHSSFITDKLTQRFELFCDSKKGMLKKYDPKINLDRKEHYIVILNILYLINENKTTLPSTAKLMRTNYIKKIKLLATLETHITKVDKLINVCFSDNILGHNSVSTKTQYRLVYALCYIVNKYYSKKLEKMTQKDNDVLVSTYRKLERAITGINKDGTKIKKEQLKTLLAHINKFDEIRKDIASDNSPISEDDIEEEKEENEDEESEDS